MEITSGTARPSACGHAITTTVTARSATKSALRSASAHAITVMTLAPIAT